MTESAGAIQVAMRSIFAILFFVRELLYDESVLPLRHRRTVIFGGLQSIQFFDNPTNALPLPSKPVEDTIHPACLI